VNQTVAKFFGVVLILIGVIGFFGGSINMTVRPELGLFPVNVLHNVVHILIGVWGLAASRTLSGATAFCKQAGVLFLLLAIIGFIPWLTEQLASLLPLSGNAAYLHLVLGLVLLYFGVMGRSQQRATA
jgi:preprotein translocase subunit Sss1